MKLLRVWFLIAILFLIIAVGICNGQTVDKISSSNVVQRGTVALDIGDAFVVHTNIKNSWTDVRDYICYNGFIANSFVFSVYDFHGDHVFYYPVGITSFKIPTESGAVRVIDIAAVGRTYAKVVVTYEYIYIR